MPQMDMRHGEDPRAEILRAVGDLDDIQVMFSQVLVGVYVRPQTTKGGILLTDNYRDEDLHQGIAMLVLKTGPDAYKDTDTVKFGESRVKVGDWVVIRPSDGLGISIRRHKCRLVPDVLVKLKISSPDLVF